MHNILTPRMPLGGEPFPPYPTATLTTGVSTIWTGYRREPVSTLGNISSNIWHPNPDAIIQSLWHNSSGPFLFLRLSGITEIEESGNWSTLQIAAATLYRSSATTFTYPADDAVAWRWPYGSSPFGGNGQTRIITIG